MEKYNQGVPEGGIARDAPCGFQKISGRPAPTKAEMERMTKSDKRPKVEPAPFVPNID